MTSEGGRDLLAASEAAEALPDPPVPPGATSQRRRRDLDPKRRLPQKSEISPIVPHFFFLTVLQVSLCQRPRKTLK